MNRSLGADGGYGIVLCYANANNSCACHHHNLEGDILNPILRLPMTVGLLRCIAYIESECFSDSIVGYTPRLAPIWKCLKRTKHICNRKSARVEINRYEDIRYT